MTSPAPLLFDTYYHIYNRGTNGENIFIEERNYAHFLHLLAKHIEPVADIFCYCMLRNHFHLSLRVKSEEEITEMLQALRVSPANRGRTEPGSPASQGGKSVGSTESLPVAPNYVSSQFSNLFNAYAKAINKAYGRTGSLFEHPFGRVPITNDTQFWNVIAYIHQNPQKHEFVRDFREWKYSSYGILLTDRHTFLKRGEVMEWFGGKESYLDLHHDWVTNAQSKRFAVDDLD